MGKAGDKQMDDNDRRDLESLFAQGDDPRMERTRAASFALYHHSGDLWSHVRSRWMG